MTLDESNSESGRIIPEHCCLLLKAAIGLTACGIRYDNEFNEVLLTPLDNSNAECILTFCPFCGCRFSESKRGNQNAMTALNLIVACNTIDDITSIIGAYDSVIDPGPGSGTDPWIRAYYFWKQLSDILVRVFEYSDGRLRRVVSIVTPERRRFLEEMEQG